MSGARDLVSTLAAMGVVVLTYIVCHGLTARVVAPIQGYFLGDITIFASLVYLPHGVRVLSVWLMGWRAVPALAAGAFLSEVLFTAAELRDMHSQVLLTSIAVGALSAYIAFEILRLIGRDTPYPGGARRMSWRGLLLVGALASVLNSVGQTIVFSGFVAPEDLLGMITIYALGDLIGQAVTMLGLMLVFRHLRPGGYLRRS